ncbi:MAG: McrC family protein [Methanosarcinales archaeon]
MKASYELQYNNMENLKPKDIELKEYEESEPIPLDTLDVDYLKSLKEVDLHERRHGYILKAKQFVGVIQLSKLRIIIKPKIGINNLFYMYEFANYLEKEDPFKDRETALLSDKDFFEFMVAHFLKKLERLFRSGIYKSYELKEENLQYVKGRILHKENLKYNLILKHRVYCQYSDLTTDNLENRIIKYTLYLLGQRTKNKTSQFRILNIYSHIGEVKLDFGINLESFKKVHYTRLNQNYKPILTICKLFIENLTVSEYVGKYQFWSFLINMDKLFEKFVIALLKRELKGCTIKETKKSIKCLSGKIHKNITLEPDALIKCPNKKVVDTVVDMKYKKALTTKSGHEILRTTDFYQIFTYANAYNCNGILIYPKYEDKELDEYYNLQDTCIRILTIDLTAKDLEEFKENCKDFVHQIKMHHLL